MSATVANSMILASFARGLKLPLKKIAYPNGEELVEKRIRKLEKFTKVGVTESLARDFASAIEFTCTAQVTCDMFVRLAQQLADTSHYGAAQLFALAKIKLDSLDDLQEPALGDDGSMRSLAREVRNDLLAIILQALKSGSPRSLNDIVKEAYADKDDVTSLTAATQSILLVSQKEQLSAAADLLRMSVQLSLIWRGIFYFSVIGDTGSSLERGLIREETGNLLSGLVTKILALAPVVGKLFEVYEIARELQRLGETLRDSDELLDKVVQSNREAQDYIDVYRQALILWANSAAVIQNSALSFMQPFLSADLSDDTNQDAKAPSQSPA